MIIIDSCTTRYKDVNFTLYGIDIITVALLEYARDLLKGDTINILNHFPGYSGEQ